MTIDEQIDRILTAKSLKAAIGSQTFKEVLILIHPDRCTHPKANEAMANLNRLRDITENGMSLADDSGMFNFFETKVEFPIGDMQKKSHNNWKLMMSGKTATDENFKKYIPVTSELTIDKHILNLRTRCASLEGLVLPQEHVNWILSRMLEVASWFEKRGFVHGSLHPNTVLITPEDHGIQVVSFYTMSQIGRPLAGASGKYLAWYPAECRKTKIATPEIDVEMCMRTAAYLLGDKTGTGVTLRRNPKVHKEFLDFIMTNHKSPSNAWIEYRELLTKHFPKKFHVLDL